MLNRTRSSVVGLQVADLVAHTCATMLLSEMGLVEKRVKVGNTSGYEPDDEVDLAFVLWASVRWNFFAEPPPPPTQWESQLDWQANVESCGLFVASSASNELRTAARQRFGTMYLGCIH